MFSVAARHAKRLVEEWICLVHIRPGGHRNRVIRIRVDPDRSVQGKEHPLIAAKLPETPELERAGPPMMDPSEFFQIVAE